jgi:hypothetical protein
MSSALANLGFPLARLPADQGGVVRVSDLGGMDAAGEHRLFVYHAIPGMRLVADEGHSFAVPQDAFAHSDPAARVFLDARLVGGASLPGWLSFEGASGLFAGTPPEGLHGEADVDVIARDSEGREAHAQFVLPIDELRAGETDRTDLAAIALALDVDKQEAEKTRAEKARAEAARPQKHSAASFSDQVRAAKPNLDPLLERIARAKSSQDRG